MGTTKIPQAKMQNNSSADVSSNGFSPLRPLLTSFDLLFFILFYFKVQL